MLLFRRLVAIAVFAIFSASTAADQCRIAFDLGSSGIRAGTTDSATTTRSELDYLGPLWAGRGLQETEAPTIAALRDLPEQAGFPANCARVGGGFSAWRLALQQGPEQLAALLERLHAGSGVVVLVMSQQREGAYGYFGARQLLADNLTTSHILDIGGGSLQIAGEQTSFGETLGQKVWHRQLCQKIRNTESTPCALQPLTSDELTSARELLTEKLTGVAAALTVAVSMTAISRPVSRGVAPAVSKLAGEESSPAGFTRQALTTAIERITRLSQEETASLLGNKSTYVAYLLSDMLLVEGLLQATGGDFLNVAELDLTNLPGLLADDQAYAWEQHYACYLDRLRSQGLEAYASDPSSCR